MNARSFSKVTRLLAALLTAALISGCCFGSKCDGWEQGGRLQSEVLELQAAERTFRHGKIPFDWDAGVFVSAETLSAAFQSLEGVRAAAVKIPNTKLEIRKAKLRTDVGRTYANLKVTARQENVDLEAALDIEGFLQYRGAELRGDPAEPKAVFAFTTTRITPSAKWLFLSTKTSRLASRLIATGVARAFSDTLILEIPLILDPELKVGFKKNDKNENSKEKTVPTGNAGTVTLKETMPESDIGPKMRSWVPLNTPNGIWLLASRTDQMIGVPDPAGAERSDSELKKLRDQLRKTVAAAIENITAPSGQIAIWLNKTVLLAIPQNFNLLNDDLRTYKVASIGHKGNLIDEMKKADVVGEGGYRVYLQGDNAVHGKLITSNAKGTWIKGSGFTLVANAKAHANMDITIEVDPYIGGGVTIDTMVEGGASGAYEERLLLERVTASQGDVLAFGHQPKCKQLELTMLAGGEIEFGARTYENIGDKLDPADVLIDPLPRYQVVAKALNAEESEQVKIEDAWIKRQVHLEEIRADDNGYWLRVRPQFELVRQKPDDKQLLADKARMLVEVEKTWQQTWAPRCPAKRAPVFLFAGQDFGPNNEIVKAVKRILDELSKQKDLQKHNVKVAVEDVKTVIKNPAEAPKVAANVAKRGLKETGKGAKKVITCIASFGHDC